MEWLHAEENDRTSGSYSREYKFELNSLCKIFRISLLLKMFRVAKVNKIFRYDFEWDFKFKESFGQ